MRSVYEYMNFRNIRQSILDYGFIYSKKKYISSMGYVLFLLLGASWFFRIRWQYMIPVIMVAAVCLPGIIRSHYYVRYQQKRFRDVDGYIHQMIYSFQKTPKIGVALNDAYKISDGKMKKTIQDAIDELRYGMSERVYEDALGIIEEQYSCDRVDTLHRFLVNVEEKGGKYHHSMDVLLGDLDQWTKGVYQSQEDVKKVKKDISIGIIISMILGATSVIVAWILQSTSSMRIGISDENIYQIVSVVFIIGCMLFYTYTQNHYKSDWLKASRTQRQIQYDLKWIYKGKDKKGLRYASARKRVTEDLYHGFSEWLRNVALGLQEKTLQTAIKDSYDTCPYVMKRPLGEFIDALELNPSDVTPYYEFLSEFQAPDISASVRTLYGLTELDHGNMDETINTLIARNYELMNRHDVLRHANRLSVMKFSEYIPVFMVSVKMGLDMMLLLTCYL